MTELLWLALGAGIAVLFVGLRQRTVRVRARRRLGGDDAAVPTAPASRRTLPTGGLPEGRVARWLARAGYRRRGAVAGFWLATAIAVALAALAVVALTAAGTFATLEVWLAETPGGIGEAFRPIALAAPWLVFVLVAAIPLVLVRARRRRIVAEVERDLPLVLELLASLAQAGLGFDAALERVLLSLEPDRVLAIELNAYRADLLGGARRADALRRLAARVDVPRLGSFVSALVQSERLGAGLADTLRRQAEDLRNARREIALMRAQALPAKLVFPLVICFLPGVFVITLGPAFFAFLNDSNLQVPASDR